MTMKHHTYFTEGTCSAVIEFDIADDNTLHNVHFVGGCNGNLQGIGKLVEGMDAHAVVDRLEGIRCGFKDTSCPDQLTRAIREVVG